MRYNMKPVFKCEYCNFIGTEEEVVRHEAECVRNYDKRSCTTCKHKSFKSMYQYKCACGKDIPVGQQYENCDKYENEEAGPTLNDTVRGLFGGVFR
jgi:hypothetical protein